LVEHPARLFSCARCREQVLLCSRCDRGQRYCGPACARAARVESLRVAARRYQQSRAGRLAHAARSRRWRERRRAGASESSRVHELAPHAGVLNFVTHHGSPMAPAHAPLPVRVEPAAVLSDALVSPGSARCRRCGAPLPPWVRQGFLRHGRRRWPARVLAPYP
jgi:hypothetical protein